MLVPVVVSLLAGGTIVISRTINGKLSSHTSLLTGTFYNYLVGLIVAILVLPLLGRNEFDSFQFLYKPSSLWIYLGGILGTVAVFLSNAVVVKISAFYVTLLMFLGQLFAGLLIDILSSGSFSLKQFLGGLLVLIGFCVNLLFDKQKASLQKSSTN